MRPLLTPNPELYRASRPRPRTLYGTILRPSADAFPLLVPTVGSCPPLQANTRLSATRNTAVLGKGP